jgi:hypothetical protein
MKRHWLILGFLLFFVASAIVGNQLWTWYKTKKQAELSIRKLALSINLEKDKQDKITGYEMERQESLQSVKSKYGENKKEYMARAKAINGTFQDKVQPLLDSVQKLKYQKYKAAAARKRIAKIQFKKMFGNKNRQKTH